MWHQFITLFIAATCMCSLIQGKADLLKMSEKKSTPFKACGPYLADMLATVCNGKYNEQYKKSSYNSDSDEDYGFIPQQPYLDLSKLPFPYRSRPNAAALLSGSFRRYTRGVSDECCRKSCTFAELKSYCGN